MPYKLRKELPSVLRWAVDGYYLYKKEGLKKPAAVLSAVSEYRREMDVISSFLSDCCTIGEGEIQSQKLYNAYCGWADDNGEYKMSHTKFRIIYSDNSITQLMESTPWMMVSEWYLIQTIMLRIASSRMRRLEFWQTIIYYNYFIQITTSPLFNNIEHN